MDVPCVIDRGIYSSAWTANSNETTTIAAATGAPLGGACISFAKVNASATTAYGLIYKSSLDLSFFDVSLTDKLVWQVNADITDVAKSALRLGTDSSNYCEWQYDDSSMTTAVWNACTATVGEPASVTGTGCDFENIGYVGIGLLFDSEASTLATIKVSQIEIVPCIFYRT